MTLYFGKITSSNPSKPLLTPNMSKTAALSGRELVTGTLLGMTVFLIGEAPDIFGNEIVRSLGTTRTNRETTGAVITDVELRILVFFEFAFQHNVVGWLFL